MATNEVILVEKEVSFKIPQQFPAIYREEGEELVALVTEYYKWLETTNDQSVYNNRRLFEYRDIGNTLSSMLQFFKKKYLADLPILDETTFRMVVKNILDLYRRKGTESGIILFFRMFFEEDIRVRYPAKYMFKPSDSKWQTGSFLQLYSNDNVFYNGDGSKFYTYVDLNSKNIYGSISKAKAVVDKINFLVLGNTLTPIIYITDVKGQFEKYDEILCTIDKENISFGKLNGSASGVEIDFDYGGTSNHSVGEIFNLISEYGENGKCIVTEVKSEFTGTISYDVVDGGFGYTVENTRLIVSDQVLVTPNPDFRFINLERFQQGSNEGYVVGQNSNAVGLKMTSGEFVQGVDIVSLDRFEYAANGSIIADNNITLTPYNNSTKTGDVYFISPLNTSSPGNLYADTGANTDVQATLINVENIALITDVIGDFLNVQLDSSDYNATPPALQPMSGSASPVTIDTPLNQAFDLVPFDIGTISKFININPGENYVNDVWAIARDDVIINFERYEQNLLIADYSSQFSVGDIVTQNGVDGLITALDNTLQFIVVRPYAYYGFNSTAPLFHKGVQYDVLAVERDYSTKKYGDNAIVDTSTNFSSGRISKVKIINSGFGYVDGTDVYLKDDFGIIHAKGKMIAASQGVTQGFWGSLSSHINGYQVVPKQNQDKDIKLKDQMALDALRVAVGLSSTITGLDTWLQTTASDGFANIDMNKDGNQNSADAVAWYKLVNNLASKDIVDRWNNILKADFREQPFFEEAENVLYTYVEDVEYYDSKMKIQDSDYYQEYSYEILSTVDIEKYRDVLKQNVHLAGTKVFGNFVYNKKFERNITTRFNLSVKEDFITGGDPIVGPNQPGAYEVIPVRADTVKYTADTDLFTADLVMS